MSNIKGNIIDKNLDDNLVFDVNKLELLNRIKSQLVVLKAILESNKMAGLQFEDYYKTYQDYEALSVLCLYLTEDVEKVHKVR